MRKLLFFIFMVTVFLLFFQTSCATSEQIDLIITKLEVVPESGVDLIGGFACWIKVTWICNGPQFETPYKIGVKIEALGFLVYNTVDYIEGPSTLAVPWLAVTGTHTVTAKVDVDEIITESDETNNRMQLVITVL